MQIPKPWPTQESGRYEKVGGQLQVPGSAWKEARGSGRDKPLGKCKVLIVRAVQKQASHWGLSLLDEAFFKWHYFVLIFSTSCSII